MMVSVLTGFFLAYGDAHWGWWILFWLAFFANSVIASVISMASVIKK